MNQPRSTVTAAPVTRTTPEFELHWAHTAAEVREALRVREHVFCREQGVPLTEERDGLDASALHLLWPAWHQMAAGIHDLSDHAIAAWSDLRDVLHQLEDIPFGDLELAVRGFGDMDMVMAEFVEQSRCGSSTGAQMIGVARPAMRRWERYEDYRTPVSGPSAPAPGMVPA